MVLTAAGASAQLKIPQGTIAVKFRWLADTVNHQTEPYSAMLIPVKLKGCPKLFFMQFDLGAPHSLFYSSKLKAIIAKYPQTDTAAFSIAKGSSATPEIIGTIGEDLIDGHILVIDYPRRNLSVTDTLTTRSLKSIPMSSFMLMNGSVLLPAKLNNKQAILFFDTGSSAFELLTSKAMTDQLKMAESPVTSYPVKSWGRTLTAHTVLTNDSLSMAGQMLPIKKATYIDGASDSQVQQMLKLGIGGMVGNKLFLSRVLLLDTRNKKFGIR